MINQFSRCVFAGLFLSPMLVFAGDYSIQVGAYKHPDMKMLAGLEKYNAVNMDITDSGLTRVRIGQFSSVSEAKELQSILQKEGYPDAFVIKGGSVSDTTTLASGQKEMEESVDVSEYTAIEPASGGSVERRYPANLTEEEKRLGVFLDGKFRIRNGVEFMTLEQFRGQ
ncbi:MAG: SPOR domain-containing protein [Gammaproteobacteria bacterium]